MTLIIVAILLVGFVLIATSSFNRINKAATAMFAGTFGWVLYICYGTDFVMDQHPSEYIEWLSGANATSVAVKQYIAQNIFLKYVGRGAEIVLFLLATMSIVEILNNNGCFDFLTQTMRTRNSRKLLWIMTITTFVISANLDNLTTTTMMLVIMHDMVPSRSQRMIYGSAIMLAANFGGALTVIGDPTGLVLWTNSWVTATTFSMSLLLPCLIAWVIPTFWLSRSLPEHIDSQWRTMPYRGDDTNLKVWQRFVMLVVGIGGLWFIPTFHNITKLSPFLGALCVLSVLWIVDELMNRRMMDVDKMIQRRVPLALQYGVIQLMLFIMGIMLAVAVVDETGAIGWLAGICNDHIGSPWIMGCIAGCVSTMLDSFATSMSFISFFRDLPQNDIYWIIIAFATAAGGSVLMIGSVAGLALMKMERIRIGWYFRHVGWIVCLSSLLGLGVMYLLH